MKLAFALYKYFPFGGLQRDMLAVARECAARGHEVEIFCQGWSGEYPEDQRIHINILRDDRRWWMSNANHRKNQRFHQDLRTALQRLQPEVVVGFNRIPGVDVYYAADTCFRAKLYQERPWLYRLLPRYRQFVRDETALFAPATRTHILAIARGPMEEYRQHYQTSPDRFTLLPPGISRSCINESGERSTMLHEELGLLAESRIILMVGSGFRTKGLDRAIEALAALPAALRDTAHLVVAGEDSRAPFEQQAREREVSDHVHFLGGRKDVPQLLKSADVLIHPARREAGGIVLLEAACAALPVITTDTCGHAHYIEQNNLGVVLSSPFLQSALDAALLNALSNDAQHKTWRENGRRFAKTADIYDMPKYAANIIEKCAQSQGAIP